MSRPAARVNDTDTGHGCWPSRPAIQGSPDIFFDGKPAHRQMDKWAMHTCKTTHDGFLSSGSTTVFTNSKQQGRVMDPISCGSFVATGSSSVFID